MDTSTVERLAREAGYDVDDDEITMPTMRDDGPSDEREHLTRFAAAIRREALEEAAMEADHWQGINQTHKCGAYIAAAIRGLQHQAPRAPAA